MTDKFIAKIMDQEVILILVDAVHYQPIILKILDKLVVKNKMRGIYVALNKPYKTVTKNFDEHGIDKDKFFFLDTLTKDLKKEKNAKFVAPERLSAISIEITKQLKSGKYDFVLFDTIDTFLVYNKREYLERFFTSLVSTLRGLNKKCIMVGIKEALVEHKLHVSIERISDEVIDLVPTTAAGKFDETFLKL